MGDCPKNRPESVMPAEDFDPDRLIDTMAPLLGLTITDIQRPGVAAFLDVARGMAAVVAAAPIEPDDFHLAPVMRPGEP